MSYLFPLLLPLLVQSPSSDPQQAIRDARKRAEALRKKHEAVQRKARGQRARAKALARQTQKIMAAMKKSAATGNYLQIVSASCPSARPKCCLPHRLWLPQRADDASVPTTCVRVKSFFCDGTSPEDYRKRLGKTVSTRGSYGDCGVGSRDYCGTAVKGVTHTSYCVKGKCARVPIGCKDDDCNAGRHVGLVTKYACIAKKPACGKTTKTTGKVWIKQPGAKRWVRLKRGEALPFKAQIRTGRRSATTLKMANGDTIRLGSRSTISLTTYGSCRKGAPTAANSSRVELLLGRLKGWALSLGRMRMEVGTLNGWAGIRGTVFTVQVRRLRNEVVTTHKVLRGKVEVLDRHRGTRTVLGAGKSLTLRSRVGARPRFTATSFQGLLSQIKGKLHLRPPRPRNRRR